ncbi:MAG: hypothetical protein ACJ72E_12565 [Marmoricola sp.]
MTAPKRRPSGRRLPARVYWFRRALVLATALALVFGVAHLLTGSSNPSTPAAKQVSQVRTTPTGAGAPYGPTGINPSTPTATGTAPTVGLASPDGPCSIDDVTVTPVAGSSNAGGPISLSLQLTGIAPACTFEVSANSLVAKITQGSKRIWSTQDCPHAVSATSVVLRSGTPTTVPVTWSGRYSDSECSRSSDWALPGTYTVQAAAIGSEPSEATVKLIAPPRPVVTKTVHPKGQKAITKRKGTTQTPATGHRVD